MRRVVLLLLCLAALPAQALDFRSVGTAAAILYDGPSSDSHRLFVVNRGFPLELVTTHGKWGRVRDPVGKLAWIELDALSTTRTVLVRKASDAHLAADTASPVCAHVQAGVLLPYLGMSANGWARVRLPDQRTAYITLDALWGA